MQKHSTLSRINRRFRTYKRWFEMDNALIGRCVELAGDVIPLDGMRFSVKNPLIQTPHKSTILFGIYELPERAFVRRHVRPTDAIVELGGSIGVVSCTINRMLADPTKHVVVEANPTLIPTLERNRALNGALFEIEHALVGYGEEFGEFTRTGHFLTGSASAEGDDRVRVRSTSVSPLIERMGISPVVLVSDIEGGELDLVRHELSVLATHVSTIIMETHPGVVGEEATAEMLDRLFRAGFDETERDGDVVVLKNARRPSGTGVFHG